MLPKVSSQIALHREKRFLDSESILLKNLTRKNANDSIGFLLKTEGNPHKLRGSRSKNAIESGVFFLIKSFKSALWIQDTFIQ